MIDHQNRVIFTHIARTGGSSIENLFVKKDYWLINPSEKHIPARVARKLYAPYWRDYFKFTVVRNPFDRFRSLWKYAPHYGLTLDPDGAIEINNYFSFWGNSKVLEVNRYVPTDVTSFYQADLRLEEGSVYGNLLHPDVNVFKFEELSKVLETLIDKFELRVENMPFVEGSINKKPPLSQKAIEQIREIHDKDFDTFGYSRDYTNK